MADAIDKLIQVNGSATLGSELFPLLANNYRNWQSKDGGGNSQARKSENGFLSAGRGIVQPSTAICMVMLWHWLRWQYHWDGLGSSVNSEMMPLPLRKI
jgi:hypothetical protein